MTVALKVYESDGTTYVDDLTTARGIEFSLDLTGPGGIQFTFSAGEESSVTLIRLDRIVKVYVDGALYATGIVRHQRKTRTDNDSAVVEVTCVGLRALLSASVVYPEKGLDAEALDLAPNTRNYGWMSANDLYDHSSWTAAASHGKQSDDPFPTARPDGWPVSAHAAEFIWSTHDAGTADPGVVYFRKSFTTAEDQNVVFIGTADDELLAYIDGQEIGAFGGVGRWRDYLSRSFHLPAGQHVLALRGTNYTRPTGDGTSPAWVLGALLVADPDGAPAQTDETWQVHRGAASGGTFKLKFDDLDWTETIAWNASAATVASKLEATHPALNVSVTGTGTSGDPWVIVADGEEQTGLAHSLAANDASLTGGSITITNTVNGAFAPTIVKTDTTWRHLPYPATDPGLSFGAIMADLVAESVARGELGPLTATSFDGDTDSGGAAWTDEVELSIPVGSTLEQVAGMLEEAGCDVYVDDLALELHEARGSDLTASLASFEHGLNVSEIVHERDGARFDRLLLRTQEGWAEQEAGSLGDPVRSAFLSAGSFATAASFQRWATETLSTYSGQADVTTITHHDDGTGYWPIPVADFGVGDTIGIENWSATATKQRVLSIAAKVDDAVGLIVWTIEAEDTGVAA